MILKMVYDPDFQSCVSLSLIYPIHKWFLPNFFSECHLIYSLVLFCFFFLKSFTPRETIFRSFRSRLLREHWLMSNHNYWWNSAGVCLLWTLRKCQYFFYIHIFVRLDNVAWTRFQAVGLLKSMGKKSLERRGVRRLSPNFAVEGGHHELEM